MRVLILLYVAEDAASVSLLFWVIVVKIYSGYLILIMEDMIKYLLRFCVHIAFGIMPKAKSRLIAWKDRSLSPESSGFLI